MKKSPKLILITSLNVQVKNSSRISLTQKFLDGVIEYQKYWSGPIVVIMEATDEKSNNLDNIEISISELPFELKIIDLEKIDKQYFTEELPVENSIVLSCPDHRLHKISKVCHFLNIPCVQVTEYSLKTRIQITQATTKNPLLIMRRVFWQYNQEKKQKKAIQIAEGVQCNGLPTYNEYKEINSNTLLYFDTRVKDSLLATDSEIEDRLNRHINQKEKKLNLLFSGRLIKMKGVSNLIKVAKELKKLGVNFELFICGDGDQKAQMEKETKLYSLEKQVTFMGVLDFESELVPFVKKNIDLFICCHPQGDPSCTYLETMSCGVPIIGYDNEAFKGLVDYSQAGWLTKMNDPKKMAHKVMEISNDYESLKIMSFKSLHFARENSFEKTFSNRIIHLQKFLK